MFFIFGRVEKSVKLIDIPFSVLFLVLSSLFLASCASTEVTKPTQILEEAIESDERIKLTPVEDKLRANYSRLSHNGLLKECVAFANLLEYPDSYQDSDHNGVVYERNLSQTTAFENARNKCSERMGQVLSSIDDFSKSVKEKGLLIERKRGLVSFIGSVVDGNQAVTNSIILQKPAYNKHENYYVTQVESNFSILGIIYYTERGGKVLNLPELFIDTTTTSVALFEGSMAPYKNVVYLYKGPKKLQTVGGDTVNTISLKLFSSREFYSYLGLDVSNLVTTDRTSGGI